MKKKLVLIMMVVTLTFGFTQSIVFAEDEIPRPTFDKPTKK
ncbi:hypothetical protein [Psychrobacillus vulpis]|nr:hypothetical protein [Psychrobacillus vulpis]